MCEVVNRFPADRRKVEVSLFSVVFVNFLKLCAVEEISRSLHFYSVSTMCFSIVLFSILNSIQVGGAAAAVQ